MRWLLPLTLFATAAPGQLPNPQRLAEQIDRRIDARLAAAHVPPAQPADDAEFLRRAYLDLTGRVPAPRDVYEFLADHAPDKRARLIDDLLETPRHASHFAAVWRAALAPETSAQPEARVFRPGFEAWLRHKFRTNTPYDAWVRELLTARLSGDPANPTPVLLRPADPNPLAFFAVKDAKPENLAAATARVFLGVRIECAQCHDHPFGRWTREQFWNQAAFFAGLERSGDGLFAPLSERPGVRTVAVGDTGRRAAAVFLDARRPDFSGPATPRGELAAWVTSAANPYFARTAVNRVWGQLFGRGLIDPVDDANDDNQPSHPELLDDLAAAFVASGHDVRFLIRAIGRTRAYQRTSARTEPGQDDPRLLARMAVKGLTGEQLFDSLVRATGYREPAGRGSPRDQFLTRFALTGKVAEPDTSIPQALALMNGSFVAEATTLDTSPALLSACELPGLTLDERVQVLYVSALSRRPTANEREKARAYVETASPGRRDERLADVFWALLNCAEFRLNH